MIVTWIRYGKPDVSMTFNMVLGTILTGVFSPDYSVVTQIIGVACVIAYVAVMAFIVFTIINKTIGLRVSKEEETEGLDVHEHGSSAYADFNFRL